MVGRRIVRKNRRGSKTNRVSMENLERRLQLSVSFSSQVLFSTGTSTGTTLTPQALITADLANNGRDDIITVGNTTGTQGEVSILLSNGNGTFAPAETYAVQSSPSAVAAADLRGNGTLDLVVANKGSNTISVLLGNGNGTFQSPETFATGNSPAAVVVADFNGDGVPDIVTADSGKVMSFLAGVDVSGHGNGSFQNAVTIGGGVANYISLAAVDLRGDDMMDLVGVDGSGNGVGVRLGNGNGTFGPTTVYPIAPTGSNSPLPFQLATASLGDGADPDIILDNYADASVGVMKNPDNGSGALDSPATEFSIGSNKPFGIATGDITGDGSVDIVTADYNPAQGDLPEGNVTVLLGNNNGTFQVQPVVSNLISNGGDSLIAVGDFEGDGNADIVVGHNYGQVGVFTNQGDAAAASKLVFSQGPSSITAGNSFTPTLIVDVENSSGSILTTGSSQITLSVNGPGTLGGVVTAESVNGVATFSGVSLNTAGLYTMTATDETFDITPAVSSNFTVSPAAADKLAITTQPTIATVGLTISPSLVVDVEDQFGNVIADSDSILVTPTGPGTLSGSTTVQADNGVATFNGLSATAAGTYTLAVSDLSESLTGATSGNLTVFSDSPAKLVFAPFSGPVTAGTGITGGFTVSVENGAGVVVTADNSNVTLGVNSGPGSLIGTLTVQAVNGVATFTGISINTAGTYTLSASDTADAVPTVDLGSFTVLPAGPSQLSFVTQPSATTAGVAISPALVVEVLDTFGNVVTSDSDNIALSVASGPSTSLLGALSEVAVNGMATFSDVVLNTAGTYTLTAADASNNAVSSTTSDPFAITPSAPFQLAFVVPPNNIAINDADSASVAVEDQFGNLISSDNANMTLSIVAGGSSSALTGSVNATAVNGVADFNDFSINAVGTYTLEVTDTADNITGTFSPLVVATPVTPAKLGINLQLNPAPLHVGAAIGTVQVIMENKQGTPLPTFITPAYQTVYLVLTTKGGTLTSVGTNASTVVNGTAMAVVNNSGTATFIGLTVSNLDGSFAFKAYDPNPSPAKTTLSVTSKSFSLSPEAIAIGTEPVASVAAGTKINPPVTVVVESANGGVVHNANSSVKLSVLNTSDAVVATYTAAAHNGVATFSNIDVDKAGNYTLRATSGTFAAVTSSSFTVTPAAVSKLVFQTQPTNITTGGTLGPIMVDLEDKFGNIETTDTGTNVSLNLSPTKTFVALSVNDLNGAATFSNVVVNTTGAFALVATADGKTAKSKTFKVTA
jgi:hypothetical protein